MTGKQATTIGAAILALCSAVTGAAAAWFGSDDGPPKIRPVAGPVAASSSFGFAQKPNKTRRSVSGIAFTRPDLAFLAFDEGIEGRFASLTEEGYRPDATPIPLRRDGEEVDAEGAASDGERLFVVGSHSMKRKGGANETSRLLARFSLGPDGRIATGSGGAAVAPETADLISILTAEPALASAIGGSLGDGAGLNIEGLALSGGRLSVGFRGPTDGEHAFLLGLDADALFDGRDPAAKLDRVMVGEGRGVRDLAAVEGGLLVLAGPDDDPGNVSKSWTVMFWNGRDAVALAILDVSGVERRSGLDGCDDDRPIKPEAIAVTQTRPQSYRVLILSDGLCDGGPMWFDVPR